MRSYIKFADRLSVSMGKAFSCEVFMAYALNAPTLWNFDFSLQMYGAIFMMAGAYTLCTEAHVRGDDFYDGWCIYFVYRGTCKRRRHLQIIFSKSTSLDRYSFIFYFLFPWCNCISLLWLRVCCASLENKRNKLE